MTDMRDDDPPIRALLTAGVALIVLLILGVWKFVELVRSIF